MTGDLLLSASPSLFLIGLITFFLAHIVYVAAIILESKKLYISRGIPFLIYGIVIYTFLLPGLGDLAVPVGLYVITICTMMWRSAARIHPNIPMISSARAGFSGAILFALSDTILAVYRFRVEIPGAVYLIISLYWVGQLGITYSAKYRYR
jgi:uncharacterized membrane protein YhhN